VRDQDDLFRALSRSRFRQRIRLNRADAAYLHRKTLPVVLEHAQQFIRDRLAPAQPDNDGRQTPMRGHPVFPAQHATATCCRGCLEKWHRIGQGRELTDPEIAHILQVIERWLLEHWQDHPPVPEKPDQQNQQFLF